MNLQQRYLYKQKNCQNCTPHERAHRNGSDKTNVVANMVNHRSKGATFAIVLPQILYLVEGTLRIHAESVTALIPTGATMTALGGTALPVSTKVLAALANIQHKLR